jgi:hypothetical protein
MSYKYEHGGSWKRFTATAKTGAHPINAFRGFDFPYDDITRLLYASLNFCRCAQRNLGIVSGSGDKRRNGKVVAVNDDSLAVPENGGDQRRHYIRRKDQCTCRPLAHEIVR